MSASGGAAVAWPSELIPAYSDHPILRVVPGPQAESVTEAGWARFLSCEYQLTERSDRMGCVLRGPAITHRGGADIISDGIAFGAVQVPGNGQPIVLMADRQTIGGYAKIATAASFDLPLLAQLLPGDTVRFSAVDLWEAREIHLRREYRVRRAMQRLRGEKETGLAQRRKDAKRL
jgi:antagonist of KipI